MAEEVFVRKASGLTREIGIGRQLFINFLSTGLFFQMLYYMWGNALYPGNYYPLTALIGLVPISIYAVTYIFLITAMPRTGGDYVWTSRILHPAVGFMVSVVYTFGLYLASLSSVTTWMWLFGMNNLLRSFAMTTNNPVYLDWANFLAVPEVTTIICALIILGVMFVHFTGLRSTLRFLTIMFILTIFSGLFYAGSLWFIGHEGFVNSFNQMAGILAGPKAGTTYESVIQAAAAEGFPVGEIIPSMVVFGSSFTILCFIGINLSTVVGGECRAARELKGQVIAILGATFLVAAMFVIVTTATEFVMGHEFLTATAYLSVSGSKASPYPLYVTLTYLYALATTNPIFNIIVCIGWVATVLGALGAWSLEWVRYIFAWSFDRVIPTGVANLDRRFRTPYVAILVCLVGAWIYLYLYTFTPIVQYLSFVLAAWFTAVAIVAIAAIVFPFRRKSIFESAPLAVQKKIGPIPVVSILGAALLISCILIVYATLLPIAITPYGPNVLGFLNYILLFIVPLPIWYVSHRYHKKKGIPIDIAQKEIPPE